MFVTEGVLDLEDVPDNVGVTDGVNVELAVRVCVKVPDNDGVFVTEGVTVLEGVPELVGVSVDE